MSDTQILLACLGIIVGGGFATLLGTLTNAILKTQQQQGFQQAEWQSIVAEKDRQIAALQDLNARQAQRIESLEERVAHVERRATQAESRVAELESELRNEQ